MGKSTRRSFLKSTAACGAAAMLYSPSKLLAATGQTVAESGQIKRIRSGCRNCGKMECGAWVTVKDGRVIKIEGDESAFQAMGQSCLKSRASIQTVYHPDRLRYPLKRTRPKGEDPGWVRISWDEAIKTTVAKYKEIIAKYGSESIVALDGTSRIWATSSSLGFQRLIGNPSTIAARGICKGPRHMSGRLTDELGFSWMAVIDRPSVYVIWGGSPEVSNYDSAGRVCVDVAKSAKHFIIVDPRLSTLGKEADIWLPLRPGTDAAMALSWIDVIIRNKLYDELYCKRWTNGPFLFCNDIEPSGFAVGSGRLGRAGMGLGMYSWDLKTRLLKESDIKEGGDPKKFMVWDQLNKQLTYFDAGKYLWKGETFTVPTEGIRINDCFLPEPSQFNPKIDPALLGEFEVKLKDGRTSKVKPVFQLLADHASNYSPDKAEKITGVPAAKIELAAKTYGTRNDPRYGNGGIQWMVPTEHYGNALQNSRALAVLVGITGNFDGPAGHRGGTRAPVSEQSEMGSPLARQPARQNSGMKLGIEKYPMLRFEAWCDSTAAWDAVNTGKPYPVKGILCQAGNALHQCNAAYAWETMKKIDFCLCVDLWHTPTSEMADILLPVQHWLEVNCARRNQGASGGMGATVRCVKPLADVKSDHEVVELMYKEWDRPFGPDPKNPWPGEEAHLDLLVGRMGMTWMQFVEKFQKDGWWDIKKLNPDDWGTYRRYEMGVLRPGTVSLMSPPVDSSRPYTPADQIKRVPGFGTPTGKQEIWATMLETFHPGENQELPQFVEPPQSPVTRPDLYKDYPLTLITGRRIPNYFHSEHRQIPWLRELWPVPKLEIHPDTAAKYNIAQGDWVWVESPHGKIRLWADIYLGISPEVISSDHRWWFPEAPSPERGFRYSEPNVMVDRHAQDHLISTHQVRGYPVKIYKAKEGAPEGIITSSEDPRLKKWLPDYAGRT